LLISHAGPLLTTALVVAEAGWLIERQLGAAAEAAFYGALAAGELRVETLTDSDWSRIGELVEQYGDLSLGGVDASLVAVAERLAITSIATLDRRDFTVVRPAHVDAFTLLP
jgi:predicted nucleic acid-binding protein